ncbi:MAG TPA: MFS transporter [Bryobacteraceae bacterium]
MSRVFYGWWIAAAAFLTLLLTVGVPFYGLPFFYDHFQRAFGWTRIEVTSGIGIATIVALPVGGLIIPRFSPKRLLLTGIVLLSASLVGFASMRGNIVFYVAMWMLFMTGYLCAGPIPHQVLISRWFVKRRGTAMALAYLGLGLGGAISQKYVALPLIRTIGWRGALLTMGLGLLVLIPLVLAVVRNRPEDRGLLPYGESETTRHAPLPLSIILLAAPFWLLAFGSFASIGSIGSINQHMKLLFLDAGLTADIAANTTFVMLISSLAGRMVMGWMADWMTKKYVMTAAYLLIALSLPLLFFARRPGVPLLFGGVFGFGLGADYMLIPLMAADLFGTHSLARVMGILLPADSIAQTVCPLLAGVLYSRAGSYGPVLVFVSVLAAAGALAVCFLPAKRERWSY